MLVTLTMAASNAAKVKAVQKAAPQSGITLVGLPVDFEITAKIHDQSLQLDPFQQYVEHRISWPQGLSGPMTTAVGLDENGDFYHIPTRIEMKKDGSARLFCTVSSLEPLLSHLIKRALPMFRFIGPRMPSTILLRE